MTAIIMLNWNGASDTIECIQSLRHVETDYFCVLTDNGSEPTHIAAIEQYLNDEDIPHRIVKEGESLTTPSLNHEFIFYQLRENIGFARGNNAAIRLIASAKPDHFLLLNNDTIVEPDFLQQLEAFATAHPDHLALTPLICYNSDRNLVWNAGGKQKWGLRKYHYAKQPLQNIKETGHIPVTFLTGCALYADASLLQQDGTLLTERFFFGEEDFEFCLRMNQQGKKMACVLTSKIYHKVNASVAHVEPLGKTYIYYLNRFIDMRQHLSPFAYFWWKTLYPLYIYQLLRKLGYSHSITTRFIAKVKKESAWRNEVPQALFLEVIHHFNLNKLS
jgi:hypothetical protein